MYRLGLASRFTGSVSRDRVGPPAGYSYDTQSRVTQMTPGTLTTLDYGYDPSGNLTTLPTGASGSYDNASELTSSTLSGTTTDYTYNADGQRTQENQGLTTISTASYNGAQRLTGYSNAAATMSNAGYNGDGLRQTTTTTPTGGTATTENYTWNPTSSSIPQLLMDSNNAYIYATGNTPLEQVDLTTGTIHYLATDLLGSVRGIVDTSGTLTASTAYDAWGNPETSGGLTNTTPFGYAGAYTDPTGLTYLIHRYYDPQTGQFLNIDPLIDKTAAAYTYATDNPVTQTDPTGRCTRATSSSYGYAPRDTRAKRVLASICITCAANTVVNVTVGAAKKVANFTVSGANAVRSAAPAVAKWSGYVAEGAGGVAILTSGVPGLGEAAAGVAAVAVVVHLGSAYIEVKSVPTAGNQEDFKRDVAVTVGGFGAARLVRTAPEATKAAVQAFAFLVGLVLSHPSPARPVRQPGR